MNALAEVTPWVTGVDESRGGSGDPSPVTACGVLHAMHAVCAHLDGDRDLRGRRVVVQGAGHVGSHLARLLVAAGAQRRRRPTSTRPGRRAGPGARRRSGHDRRGRDDRRATSSRRTRSVACSTPAAVDRLQCRAVVGAANNQLAGRRRRRDARGTRCALRARLRGGRGRHHQHRRGVHRLRPRSRPGPRRWHRGDPHPGARGRRSRGRTPQRAAEELADRRVREEGAGRRWQPGDPAAWTNGEPLTRLRP